MFGKLSLAVCAVAMLVPASAAVAHAGPARATDIPCDIWALGEAIFQANHDGDGSIVLAAGCLYKFDDAKDKLPKVTRKLTITGADDGATIAADLAIGGTLTLNSLQVQGKIRTASYGALILNGSTMVIGRGPGTGDVISNSGSVTLNDDTTISGGGLAINNDEGSIVTMNDRSSIHDNRNGGIYNIGGTVVMNDDSIITRSSNTAIHIDESGSVTLNGRSSITGNTATAIWDLDGTVTLNDDSSIVDNPDGLGCEVFIEVHFGELNVNDNAQLEGYCDNSDR